MNELANKLNIELKPFCVRSDEFPNAQICQDFLDRCVALGAARVEGVSNTSRQHNYVGYFYMTSHDFWGVTDYLVTSTFDWVYAGGYGCELITYQQMLNYLHLTEKDGRLISNEELNRTIPTKDYGLPTVSSEVPMPLCTPPKSSTEPVSMIKSKLEVDLERLMELIVASFKREPIVDERGAVSSVWLDSKVHVERLMENLPNFYTATEYRQDFLDKQIEETQTKLNELLKLKEGK